jgi:hypothetical protein
MSARARRFWCSRSSSASCKGLLMPGHLQRIVDPVRHHRHAVGHGELDHVGQVVLALGVAVVQPRQPAFEQAGRHGHDAAVDLVDLALGLGGVLLLDDGQHRCSIARAGDVVPRPAGMAPHDAP